MLGVLHTHGGNADDKLISIEILLHFFRCVICFFVVGDGQEPRKHIHAEYRLVVHDTEHELSVLALSDTPKTEQLQELIEGEYRHVLIRRQSFFPDHAYSLIDEILNVLESILEWQKRSKLLWYACFFDFIRNDKPKMRILIEHRQFREGLVLLDMRNKPLS